MYDWNRAGREQLFSDATPLVVDETLRDGLQSPSVRAPGLDERLAIVRAMSEIGVDVVSLGLPAAHKRALDDAVAVARAIQSERLPLRPSGAARTTEGDVQAVVEASQRAGMAFDVYSFIGSSPIRHFVETWDVGFLVAHVKKAAETARRGSLPFVLVTEDTTRASPEVLTALFLTAIECGASRLCLCDTAGHVDPHGVVSLFEFVNNMLASRGIRHVGLDWHGHNDRGLGLANAIEAARNGATRVHGTAFGIGERVGNVPTETLVYNLAQLGLRAPPRLDRVRAFSDVASKALGVPVWHFEPLVGAASRSIDAERESLREPPARSADRFGDEPLVPIRLTINGDLTEAAVRPSRTLLEFLRYDLDLVGTKQGCDKGDCGACTVLVDGEPRLACLTLAVSGADHRIDTVESLAGAPDVHPLLDAFDRCGAGQCGFCTPGMLVTAAALLEKDPKPSRDAIKRALSGNLCRCTGYGAIFDAVELAAKIRAGQEPVAKDWSGVEHVPPPLAPLKGKAP